MGAITYTAANVKLPNETEVIKIRGVMGAASIVPGMAVYLDGTSGWKAADADVAASGQARGILATLPNGGVLSSVGDRGDIVTEGRITGYEGMTPGAAVFASVTAGRLDQTPAGNDDYTFAIGWAESATTIYVHPQITVPIVNPSA
jgi:hypothetical protein